MYFSKRKPNRLKDYDYSNSGAYFITICVKDRHELLWNVGATFGRPQDKSHLSAHGLIVDNEINKIDDIYGSFVCVDKYVIMPNHIHLIILLKNSSEVQDGRPQVAPTISRIIQQFKGSVTKQMGFSLWQKLYHDHVIRDEQAYQKIGKYIDENPMKWSEDCYYKPNSMIRL